MAYVRAKTAAAAVERALDVTADDPAQFVFGEPWGETKMRARRVIPPAEKGDCVSVGFSGEGRCIEVATTDGLCDQHAEQPSARRFDEHG
ncbi:hypothetical protein [Nocardioides pakistanensis]